LLKILLHSSTSVVTSGRLVINCKMMQILTSVLCMWISKVGAAGVPLVMVLTPKNMYNN